MRNYTDVIKVLPWNNGEAEVFIDKYTSIINRKDIKETILQDGNKDDLKEIFQNPFETALLTFIVEEGDFKFNEELSNRFVLYEHFFQCWIKREVHRKTSNGEVNSIADELYYASVQIYKGKKATVTTKDTAVTGLLIPYGKTARFENEYKLFYHRSFCAFFIARKIQHCFINNSKQLLQLFSQPLKNDVTDFVNNSFANDIFFDGNLKKEVADLVVNKLGTIQEKYYQIINSDIITSVLDKGAEVTSAIAKNKYNLFTLTCR